MSSTKHRSRTRRRYPWANLAEHGKPTIADDRHDGPSNNDWARYLQVTPHTVAQWIRNGLHEWTADRIACTRLGVHPSTIWPEWFDE